jgi:hypothetical protein
MAPKPLTSADLCEAGYHVDVNAVWLSRPPEEGDERSLGLATMSGLAKEAAKARYLDTKDVNCKMLCIKLCRAADKLQLDARAKQKAAKRKESDFLFHTVGVSVLHGAKGEIIIIPESLKEHFHVLLECDGLTDIWPCSPGEIRPAPLENCSCNLAKPAPLPISRTPTGEP